MVAVDRGWRRSVDDARLQPFLPSVAVVERHAVGEDVVEDRRGRRSSRCGVLGEPRLDFHALGATDHRLVLELEARTKMCSCMCDLAVARTPDGPPAGRLKTRRSSGLRASSSSM